MPVTLSGMIMLVKLVQPLKEPMSMLVTLEGIVILDKRLQPSNVDEPILVNWLFPSNVTLVKFLQL